MSVKSFVPIGCVLTKFEGFDNLITTTRRARTTLVALGDPFRVQNLHFFYSRAVYKKWKTYDAVKPDIRHYLGSDVMETGRKFGLTFAANKTDNTRERSICQRVYIIRASDSEAGTSVT